MRTHAPGRQRRRPRERHARARERGAPRHGARRRGSPRVRVRQGLRGDGCLSSPGDVWAPRPYWYGLDRAMSSVAAQRAPIRRLSRVREGRGPFLVVAAALFTMLMAGNLPTPLYAVYRERFGFSSTELTLIFATYMLALIPSLLLFGQLSDRVGRRRVIAAGLGAAALGLACFAAARGTAWLFAARAIQGIGLGATVGTAAAALVELEPTGNAARAALA